MYAHPRVAIDELSPEHLWGVLILLSIGDILTTMFALKTETAVEANPVVSAAIASTGLWVLVPLKLAMLAIWRKSFKLIPQRYELGFLIAGTAYFGVIVLVNIGVLGTRMGVW